MMQICPKCGHQRKLSDGCPDWQCPNCGIAYCKAIKTIQNSKPDPTPRKQGFGYKVPGLLLMVLMLLIAGYYKKTHLPPAQPLPLANENSIATTTAALSKDPIQVMVEGKIPAFEKNGYSLTPLASFELKAKVLSRENYWLGRTADLSPTDLALGWGSMATEEMLQKVAIRQSNRWWFWRVEHDFTPELGREISTHGSNMHIIPANSSVEQTLSSVKSGQIVYIKGYLMEANASDGWKWRSSLSREDTGDGSCELLWAEQLQVQ